MTQRPLQSLLFRSLLGALWFGLWFFVVIPGAVLWAADPAFPTAPEGPTLWIGIAIVGAAHVVIALEVLAFARHGRGTHMPFDPPAELVGAGLYRSVRNPMYLAYLVVVVGEALAFRSFELLGYATALAVVAHVYVVFVEERDLRERFGRDYERYCENTGRWLPRL